MNYHKPPSYSNHDTLVAFNAITLPILEQVFTDAIADPVNMINCDTPNMFKNERPFTFCITDILDSKQNLLMFIFDHNITENDYILFEQNVIPKYLRAFMYQIDKYDLLRDVFCRPLTIDRLSVHREVWHEQYKKIYIKYESKVFLNKFHTIPEYEIGRNTINGAWADFDRRYDASRNR